MKAKLKWLYAHRGEIIMLSIFVTLNIKPELGRALIDGMVIAACLDFLVTKLVKHTTDKIMSPAVTEGMVSTLFVFADENKRLPEEILEFLTHAPDELTPAVLKSSLEAVILNRKRAGKGHNTEYANDRMN